MSAKDSLSPKLAAAGMWHDMSTAADGQIALRQAVFDLLGDEAYVVWDDPRGFWLVSADHEALHNEPLDAHGIIELAQKWSDILAEDPPPTRVRFSEASLIKSRKGRPLNPAVAARREALIDILERVHPCTVRQCYYQPTVYNIVEKTEPGYQAVQRDLVLLRRQGRIPYGWITDGSRLRWKPRTFTGLDHVLRETAELYRRDLWAHADCHVEIWIEKDALRGTIFPVTAEYDVPLFPARGYSSETFAFEAAEEITEIGKATFVYHFGDFDPSGQDAARDIEAKLRRLAPRADIHFRRVAVTPAQITEWSLPTRPTKSSDPRSKHFGDISVELDAIDPNRLRDLVRNCIEAHIDKPQLEILRIAEASERELLRGLGGGAA